jgi:hypothetical protein
MAAAGAGVQRPWVTYVYTETAASDSEGVVPFYHDPTKTNEARRREVLGDIQTVVPLSSTCMSLYPEQEGSAREIVCACAYVYVYVYVRVFICV